MLADYWILSIAICTYLILMDYAHAASWVQNHRAAIWCMAWGLSILWGVLGLVVVGYGYAGGCMSPFGYMVLRRTIDRDQGAGSPVIVSAFL